MPIDTGGKHQDITVNARRRPRRRRLGVWIGLAIVSMAALGIGLAGTASDPAVAVHAAAPHQAQGRVHSQRIVTDVTATAGAASPRATTATSATGDAPPPTATPWAPGVELAGGSDQSDPFLTSAAGNYLLLTSGGVGPGAENVPLSTSKDFSHWTAPVDALPTLPVWAVPGFTWAPDFHPFGSQYALYFTAMVANYAPQTECIGSAFSTSPTGPFTAQPAPIICQLDQGGSIDPRVFVDSDGTPWMLWKSDQNIGGSTTPTKLWSQRISPDGTHLLGSPSDLMSPDEAWQGTILEAPDMVEVAGSYWVVYSANWFNSPDYAIGAARCLGPAGPCADTSPTPLLSSNFQGQGPGEAAVFQDSTGTWMLYSPWRSLAPHPDIPARPVYITRVGFTPGGAYLAAGPLPSGADLVPPPLWPPFP